MKWRTQASLAVSASGAEWLLINASPDLRAQISVSPQLRPRDGIRESPIVAVLLTGAEIDQVAGLLTLRERQAFGLYATRPTLDLIAENRMFDVLDASVVSREAAEPGEDLCVLDGLEVVLFNVVGKPPLYREADASSADNVAVGVQITSDNGRLLYLPSCAEIGPALRDRLTAADTILFDGTFYSQDEMMQTGTGTKTAQRMGHVPIDGAGGSLALLSEVSARRIYIHINNTNPILVEGSAERRRVESSGWEIAEDGLEIAL